MQLLAEAFERDMPSLHFPHLQAGCGVSGKVSEELTEPSDVRCLGPWVCGTSTIYPDSDDTELLQKQKKMNLCCVYNTIKTWVRGFPGSSLLKTWPSGAGVWVQSLIGELRSHMSWGQKKKKQQKQKQYCNKFIKDFKNGPHQKIFIKSWVTMCYSSWLTLTLCVPSPSTLCTSLPLPHSIPATSLPTTPQRLQDHSHCE